MRLTELTPGTLLEGIIPGRAVTVVSISRHGDSASTVVFRDETTGAVDQQLVFAADQDRLRIIEGGRAWAFDAEAPSQLQRDPQPKWWSVGR